MIEELEKILEVQRKRFEERMQRLDNLIALRPRLRKGLNPKSIEGEGDESVVAVDSAYKPRKDVLGRIEYAVVGVASWIMGHDYIPFYNPDFGMVLYEEDYREEAALLEALGAVVEISLISKHSGQFRWALSDGSFFSTLIRLKAGLEVATKRGKGGIYDSVRGKVLHCVQDIEKVLRRGNLLAVPKFSSGREVQNYVRGFWQEAEKYNDFELCTILLNKGEYVDMSFSVERERVERLLRGLGGLGFELSQDAVKRLENFRLFYVKGFDGIVHRVEFFSSESFPADVIYSQSLSGTSQLELIAQADKAAKEYLNLIFPEEESFFDAYR